MIKILFRCITVCVIASWSGAVIFAQEPEPEANRSAVASDESRNEIIKALLAAEVFVHTQLDSAEYFLNKAISISRNTGNDSLLMEAYFVYCRFAQLETEFDTALLYTRKAGAIAFANQYTDQYGEYYNFLARYHKYLNHADSALYYLQVYDSYLAERDEDHKRWLSQQSLALFYLDFPDYEKANFHIDEALRYARILKTPKNYLYVLFTAIDIYSRQDSLSRMSSLNEEYLKFKHDSGTNILENSTHAHLLLPLSDSTNRLTLIQKFLHVHLLNRDTLSAISSYHAIGDLYTSQQDYVKAIDAYEHGLVLANLYGYPSLRYTNHVALFLLYDQLQNPAMALHHHKAMSALLDTIRNEEREILMHDLEVKYETAEKEHQLFAANYQLEGARRRQQLYALSGLALIFIITAILYAYTQKRRAATQLAEKNAIILRSLAEKDILLREIHHRVKNNLQMISALLYLHGKSVEDTSAQEALLESQNRVQSMAMIHQDLYQDENLLGVSVKNYLDRLLGHLIASYNVEKDRIEICTRIEVEQLDVDTIVPLALIINELISNCLKYAFQDGRKGVIDVYVGQLSDHILVEVRDNGIGLPAGFLMHTSTNFGYKLINILSDRLGAVLSVTSQNGTQISLSIPVKKAA